MSRRHRGLAEGQQTPAEPHVTQVMWLGSPQQLAKVDVSEVPVLSTRINVSETARDLGVVIDSHLSLSAQVAAVCRSGYYQPRQLRPLVRSMSAEAVKTPVQAFISCRLDYYNSLFYCIAEGLMSFCSLSRMRLHVWCPALDITTASRQCYRCCTSFQFHVVWISRWPHW